MATYLQGVTDYIPEFQPFQPDLNFYNSLMATKQTQYDNNWKAINKVYGQYFYADLSREDNIQIKDELMKNIDFNLRRVSGLDLSLDQNVQQAVQVFKPFYEDKYLMKDMAYTKNYQNQRNRGLALKNARTAEERGQYWDTGVKALDYKREEFRQVSREESLNVGSSTYTPYVNALDKYQKLAKDWGISYDATLPDASGNYMIRQKNGDVIIPALQTLFQSYGANDPQLQDVYYTQSYVNRKDYVAQHAADFGGDQNAAEKDYLTQAGKTVSDYVANKNSENQKQNEGIKKEITRVEEVKDKDQGNLFTDSYLERLNSAAGYTEAAAAASEQLDKEINNASVTAATTGGSFDTSEDTETLRRKVDAGIASMLMDADISEAAYVYSRKDMVYEMKESQRGLESLRQQNRLNAIAAKQKADEWNLITKNNLEKGIWLTDAKGDIYPKDMNFYNPNPVGAVPLKGDEDEEDKKERDIEDENKYQMDQTATFFSKEWVDDAYNLVTQAYKQNLITKEEYGKFFSLDFTEKNYASSKEAGRDILNKATTGLSPKGKTVAGKLIKGFGIDQAIGKMFGSDAMNSVNEWIDKKDTPKAKSLKDKKNDSTVTKILDVFGITDAFGKLYYQSPDEFYNDYKSDPSSFLYGQAESLGLIKAKVDALAGKLRGDNSIGDNYIMNTIQSGSKMDKFIMHAEAVKQIQFENVDAIQTQLAANTKLYDIAKGDKTLIESLTKSFYDGGAIISKEAFKDLVKSKLNVADKDYHIYGKIASTRAFENNELTRADLVESVFAKDSNLSKAQKYELVDQILFAQKQRAKEKVKNKDKRGAGASGEGIGVVQGIVGNYLKTLNNTDSYAESIYDNMLMTYNKTVKDPTKVKILTPLLQEVTTSGGKASVYSRGESGVEVHLDVPETFKPFVEFIQSDMRNINFSDVTNNAISLTGTTKSAFDKARLDTDKADMLYRMIQDLYTGIGNKTDVKPFKFTQRQIAGENRNLGAMVIYPDKEFLDKYKAGKDEPGLSAEDINNALKYGISVISPRQNFTNSLFTQNMWTPMQIAVKGKKDGLVLTEPYGGGAVKIQETKIGKGDYTITTTINMVTPEGKIETTSSSLPNLVYGNNLDSQIDVIMQQLNMISVQNNAMYQKLSPEQQKMVSGSKKFKNIPASMYPILQGSYEMKQAQYELLNR